MGRGTSCADLRIVLGAVELEESCSLGVCDSIRTSVPTVRDAVARLRGLSAVRSPMRGRREFLLEPTVSGEMEYYRQKS